ncbi:MAG: TolB family protein [bacterium]
MGELRIRYEQCVFWQESVHFACPLRWLKVKDVRESVITDGHEGKRYLWINQLRAVDEKGGTAYLAHDAAGGRIVIRGREGVLWKGKGLRGYILGPLGRTYFYHVYEGGKWRYFLNGRPGRVFPSIDYPRFSRDGRTFAFMMQLGSTLTREVAIWNGRQSGPEYSGIQSLVLSPDGKAMAFSGIRENKYHVVVNGIESPAYQSVNQLRFGPDGKTLSYEAWSPNQNPFFVIGGKEMPPEEAPGWANERFRGVSMMHFPETGERRYKFGDVTLPTYSDIRDVRWLPDGRTPVFHVAERSAEFYVKGTQEEEKHRFAWSLVVASHDNCIGYKVRDADEERVVVCGVAGKLRTQVGPPVFAPYTNDFAYRANQGGTRPSDSGLVEGGRWLVVVNGRDGPDYDMVWDPFFDPQLKRIAYYAYKARRLVLINSNLE